MFPLGTNSAPADGASLKSAIGEGLRPLSLDSGCVVVEGTFPALVLVRSDLTGAKFTREHRAATFAGPTVPGFFTRRAEAVCEPATFEGIPFSAKLGLDDATFSYGRSEYGEVTLVLERCIEGNLEISVTCSAAESAIFGAASRAAEEQGAELKSVSVMWTQSGSHALQLKIAARAKAMFVEAGVTVTGRIEVIEGPAVRICDLACSGEGMVGNLASTFLRKEIPKYEGRSIALNGVFGGIRLHTVLIHADPERVTVRAKASR